MKVVDVIKGLRQGVTLFPGLVRVLGRNESLLVTQLLYWMDEDREWVYKKSEDIEWTTTLTWREQKRARENLVEMGILKESYKRDAHHIGFKINQDKLNKIFAEKSRGQSTQTRVPAINSNASASQLKRDWQSTQTRVLSTEKSYKNSKNSKNVIARTARESVGGFFGRSELTFDEIASKKLHEAISKASNLQVTFDLKTWSKEFELLRLKDGASKERIKAALKFYMPRIGEMMIPEAFCAKSFRKKFIRIEIAMRKEQPSKPEKIEIDPKVQVIVNKLLDLHWPKGSRDQLRSAVQKSFDSYSAWLSKLEAARPRMIDGALLRLDRELSDGIFGDAAYFVRRWFDRVNERVNKWEDWGGDLSYFIFSPRHPDFLKLGRTATQDFCGDPDRWDKYLEFIA